MYSKDLEVASRKYRQLLLKEAMTKHKPETKESRKYLVTFNTNPSVAERKLKTGRGLQIRTH
jgi:hypothetical protein